MKWFGRKKLLHKCSLWVKTYKTSLHQITHLHEAIEKWNLTTYSHKWKRMCRIAKFNKPEVTSSLHSPMETQLEEDLEKDVPLIDFVADYLLHLPRNLCRTENKLYIRSRKLWWFNLKLKDCWAALNRKFRNNGTTKITLLTKEHGTQLKYKRNFW